MTLRSALFCLGMCISAMLSSKAQAHIDFKGDFECKGSYETGCILMGAEIDRRTMWIFFDGPLADLGDGTATGACNKRTAQLVSELNAAGTTLGLAPNTVKITSVRLLRGSRDFASEYRCSYEVVSTRKDLRFKSHHLNRRFWTSEDERNGVCMDDVRQAQAIPGSIGAAKWITAALAQGYMCNTNYATMGLVQITKDENGNVRILKYGDN